MAATRCERCGCTADQACVVAGVPCCWISETLCSACADIPELVASESGCQWLGVVVLAGLYRLQQPVVVTGRVLRREVTDTRRSPCSPTGRCGTLPRKT